MFDICFIDAVSLFIKKTWKQAATEDSKDLTKCKEGLYGVKFQCYLDGPSLDPNILASRSFACKYYIWYFFSHTQHT